MSARRSLLLRAFFAELDRGGHRWCVVGDARALPDRAEHDVDLVLEPEALAGAPALLAGFAAGHGVALVQDLQHEVDARFFVLAWLEPDGPRFLYLDLCADWRRDGRLLLRADDLLGRRIERPFTGGRFWTPAPAANFAYYLLKRLDKGALDAVQAAALGADFAADPAGCRDFLARRLAGHAAMIAAAADGAGWAPVLRDLGRLREAVRRSALARPPRIAELARRCLRFARPSGLLLHLATSADDAARDVCERIRAAWAPAFRRVAHLERTRALDRLGYLAAIRPLLVRTSLVTLAAPALATGLARLPEVLPLADVAGDADAVDRRLLAALARRQAGRREFGWLRWGC